MWLKQRSARCSRWYKVAAIVSAGGRQRASVNDCSRQQTTALSPQSFNSVSHETAKCPMPKPKYKQPRRAADARYICLSNSPCVSFVMSTVRNDSVHFYLYIGRHKCFKDQVLTELFHFLNASSEGSLDALWYEIN